MLTSLSGFLLVHSFNDIFIYAFLFFVLKDIFIIFNDCANYTLGKVVSTTVRNYPLLFACLTV